jgi:hypothetical protein
VAAANTAALLNPDMFVILKRFVQYSLVREYWHISPVLLWRLDDMPETTLSFGTDVLESVLFLIENPEGYISW